MYIAAESITAYAEFKSVLKELRTHPDCREHEKALDKLDHAATMWTSAYIKGDSELRTFMTACDEVLAAPPFAPKSSSFYNSPQMERLNASLLALRDLSFCRQDGIHEPKQFLTLSCMYTLFLGVQNTILGLLSGTLLFPAALAPIALPYMFLGLFISCASQIYGAEILIALINTLYWNAPNELESKRELLLLVPIGLLGSAFFFGSVFGSLAAVMMFGSEVATTDMLMFGFHMGIAAMASVPENIVFGLVFNTMVASIAVMIDALTSMIKSHLPWTKEEDLPSDTRLCIM